MTGPVRSTIYKAVAVFALLLAAYANHFQNGFHFDDGHAIVNNVFVRDIRNIPRFFTDATTSSVLPLNRSYRPALQTTLAVDYAIAGGYHAWAFQVDSFLWFVLQLACMWWLFSQFTSVAFALMPVAVYALHPVCAETVNYIIQRGDIMSTCGVVAALALYAGSPRARRSQLFLIPYAIAVLAKPPAMVFPALLLAYVVVMERRPMRTALATVAPSLGVTALLALWSAWHTPPTFTTGGGSLGPYLWTQAFVWLRYAAAFFAPVDLSADNDWSVIATIADGRVLAGLAFVGALVWAIVRTSQRDDTRPIAFGLIWFVLALIPTSVVPLAEVGNDHRMFFPFVGFSLAVCWAAWLWARRATVALVAIVLIAEAVGVHARNDVWRTDESLWYDVTVNSPTNGRGLMNYGLTRMAAGDYATALTYFERALAFTPNYSLLHINLGIAYGGVGRLVDAEREFTTAIRLAPDDWRSHLYYGRWLRQIRRSDEALAQLELAARENPTDPETTRELAEARVGGANTPEGWVERSLAFYRAGRYRECIDAARRALDLRPGYAEAYNNIAAGEIAMGEWDAGIAAAE